MATTDLKLDDPGTLPKPGPIGRIVRLGLGYACLNYVFALWIVRDMLTSSDGSIRALLWSGVVWGLILISYIVNIGFSRSWKKWPAVASMLLLLVAAGINYILHGSIEGQITATVVYIWLLYSFTHLGLAFILSAIIGTPGCEMRAFHHFYSIITGRPTKEHYCPVGPLNAIDKWEAGRQKK